MQSVRELDSYLLHSLVLIIISFLSQVTSGVFLVLIIYRVSTNDNEYSLGRGVMRML